MIHETSYVKIEYWKVEISTHDREDNLTESLQNSLLDMITTNS